MAKSKSFDALVKRTTTKTTQRRAAVRAQQLLRERPPEMFLREIRQLRSKTQKEIAAAIGIKQPSLSKLEKQSDMQISTLGKIIGALGGELEIRARFPNGTVKIEQFSGPTHTHGRSADRRRVRRPVAG